MARRRLDAHEARTLRWQLATCATAFVAAAGWVLALQLHFARAHERRHAVDHRHDHACEIDALRARQAELEVQVASYGRGTAEITSR
jgi:hypothetical protein